MRTGRLPLTVLSAGVANPATISMSEATESRTTTPASEDSVWTDTAARECGFRLDSELVRRPCNGLNIEWFGASSRCFLKPDEIFNGDFDLAKRWILSGGSVFVFGRCSARCPKFSKG